MTAAGTGTAFKTVLTLEPGVEQAMREAHDALIAATSDVRASGVQWSFVRGRYDVLAWLHASWTRDATSDVLEEIPEATATAFRDQARAMVREHGDQVVVVIASCRVGDGP